MNELGLYEKAVQTVNNLIRIKPYAHDLYLTGMLYEKVGDSEMANLYFKNLYQYVI